MSRCGRIDSLEIDEPLLHVRANQLHADPVAHAVTLTDLMYIPASSVVAAVDLIRR